MFARIAFGVLVAGAISAPALAEQMNANEARKFVANKLFAFNCFDGTKGVGRVYEDGSASGSVQFGGTGQLRLRAPLDKGEAQLILGRDFRLDAELAARIERIDGVTSVRLSVAEPPRLALVS